MTSHAAPRRGTPPRCARAQIFRSGSVWTICKRLTAAAGAMASFGSRVVLATFGPRALAWALAEGVGSLTCRDALLVVGRLDAAASELGPAADADSLQLLKLEALQGTPHEPGLLLLTLYAYVAARQHGSRELQAVALVRLPLRLGGCLLVMGKERGAAACAGCDHTGGGGGHTPPACVCVCFC
jgi:hypothetical protein